MTEIATTLRQEVERKGIISFARFMELALYCPNSGYYEQAQSRIGKTGDFYTSVSVGPLFGQLLASCFCRWLAPAPQPVQLVEAGAHGGHLASDILAWIQAERPDVFARLTYCLVEPSARHRDWQKRRLADFAETIRWVDQPRDLGPATVNGVIFSNELLDAFPVHRLAWAADVQRWRELGVAWDQAQERFVWQPMRNDPPWERALETGGLTLSKELSAVLPDGFLLDWCPTATDWWREAARCLGQGALLTFDYGFTAEEILVPQRRQGTLRGFVRHHAAEDLLAAPGQQDLTADVNFDQIRLAGEQEGLRTETFVSQARFLTRLAGERWQAEAPNASEVRQFQALTHPEHLGRAFRVLVQSRGEIDCPS